MRLLRRFENLGAECPGIGVLHQEELDEISLGQTLLGQSMDETQGSSFLAGKGSRRKSDRRFQQP